MTDVLKLSITILGHGTTFLLRNVLFSLYECLTNEAFLI